MLSQYQFLHLPTYASIVYLVNVCILIYARASLPTHDLVILRNMLTLSTGKISQHRFIIFFDCTS